MFNPLRTHLHIFQLEGYSPLRFFKWWLKHPLTFSTTGKKPLLYTFKAKLLLSVVFCLYLVLIFLFPFPINFFVILFLAFEPIFLLLPALLIIKPYEITRRLLTVEFTRHRVGSIGGLTVVGITGSYGKTTSKDILYTILNHYQYTLKTPESYNTVFGIFKVVNLELNHKHKYFICEMGAYVRGEIKELTHMVPPDYALLTAIGTQHLERFKSIKNTTLAKFELVDAVDPDHALVNFDNPHIAQHIKEKRYKSVKTFSVNNHLADYFLTAFTMKPDGMSFTLNHLDQQYQFQTKLFGTSNLQNLVGAISMALMLKVPVKSIQSSIEGLQPSPHRLQLSLIDKATLIDNAYSSNREGFINIVNDLAKLPGKKAIITPGIIELGAATADIHQELGELAAPVFDTIILVGQSERTRNFEKGLHKGHSLAKVQYLDNGSQLWPEIDLLAKNHSWILLENDLPDNF